MFLVNSRLGLFTAASFSFRGKLYHLNWHSFSRSYGVNMPSSLNLDHPIASVFSTRLPVSVLVRAPYMLLRGFFQKYGITDFS